MVKYFGIAGSVLLIIGAFTPVIYSPFTGGISFIEGTAMTYKGVIIILLGVTGCLFFFKEHKKYEMIVTFLSVIIISLFFLVTVMQISRLANSGGDAMSRWLASMIDALSFSYSLSWGWLVLATGLGLKLYKVIKH